jgi:MOSC domain-containing protein YiiM
MGTGRVESIHTAPAGAAPVVAHDSVEAQAGRGLVGDRYFLGNSSAHAKGRKMYPGRQVTLIEAEAVEAAARDQSIVVPAGDIRRNLVTRGVPLNHLVGREFSVGHVRLRGIQLCEPCNHMETLAGRPGVREALVHRGGLNAEILTSGTIRIGDLVRWD